MFHNHIKIAIRYLFKNKLYTALNILGLSIGIASFMLIMLYVNYERSFDTFKGSGNTYRVYLEYLDGDAFVPGDAQTSNLTGPSLKELFPEVIEYVRFFRLDKAVFVHHDQIVETPKGAMADASYFEVFPYPLIKGNPQQALEKPNSVVLSESVSKQLFGGEDPMGKSITMLWSGTKLLLTITGIREDSAAATHFENNFLISFNSYKTWSVFEGQARTLNWDLNMYYTYIKVADPTNFKALQAKIIQNNLGNDDQETERHNIEPIQDIHLYSNKPYEIAANGSISRIKFLSAIALIIIVLSWFNYINLSTTKSLERAKEIGIRKVAGAKKKQLIFQSILESITLNGIALAIAVVLIFALFPWYKLLIGKALIFNFLDTPWFLYTIFFMFFGILCSSLYPAFVLSNYSPSKALKGKIQTSPSSLMLRKGLITVQFLATIILLIGTIVVSKQIHFIAQQPSGVELDRVLAIQGEVMNTKPDSLIVKDYETLEVELRKLPFITLTSGTQTYPGDSYDNLGSFVGITYPDGTEEEKINYYNYGVNPDYFEVVGIDFLAGKGFLPTTVYNGDQIVVNEKVAKLMGFFNVENAIGKTVKFWGREWIISGVMENYHHFGLKNTIQPLIITKRNTKHVVLAKLHKSSLSSENIATALSSIEERWKTIFPHSTFNYTFIDQKFQAQYAEDQKFKTAFQIFTALAILIASLGLFGLTSYTCIQRKKEIGIRKVNGATIGQILRLLNREFIIWIGIAFVVAVPLSWSILSSWLQDFAYKITMSWWIFGLAGLATLCIALLTVSWQSFKAAIVNPIETLRNE